MDDRFVAIDFETANADLASICQVGVVTFARGAVLEAWGTLVNPEDYFDWINVDIHGIDEHMVKDAPTFPRIIDALATRTRDEVVVSHTSFDRAALSQALEKYGLNPISCTWLDSASVVRRTWNEFSRNGYGLGNVCSALGIEFRAHDAVEDARAAGEVLLQAIRQTGLDLPAWLARVKQPIDLNSAPRIAYDGNPDGPLFGEEIVFTGALTIPRREAAALAAGAGSDVTAAVKKSTTLLIVGDQDVARLAGHEKSAKHRKAEELIAKGQRIRILRESDFVRLIDVSR
jgi:DNA polymerase-3 subunit epsilon